MAFELFTRVALREDFPKHQLYRGDVATIVEHHPVANREGDRRNDRSFSGF